MSKVSSAGHDKYRPDIDGLRAIAVLSVVIFHAFPKSLTGGFIGVDVFFVISGFLISSILFSNLENNHFSILNFYKKRILRIYPSLLTVMIVSFIFSWFILFSGEYMQLGKHLAGGAAFISNLVLWKESSYFDTDSLTKPLLHLWSLAIEEQFYIFWPLLLAFVWRRRWNFLIVTSVIGLFSFSLDVYLTKANPTSAFYFPIPRFWELMIGGSLAYITLHKPQLIASYRNHQSIAGVALIGIGVLLINQSRAFPGWWALFPSVGAFLVISAGPNSWINKNILSSKVLVWFGLISYPLYLWHWPLFSFTQIQYGEVSDSLKIGLIALSIALAWITFRFIEKPVRYRNTKNTTAITLFSIMILVGVTGFYTYKSGGFEGSSIRTKEKNEFLNYFENSRPNWKYFTKINRAEKYRYDCDFYDLEKDKLGQRSVLPRESINNNCYQRDPKYQNAVFIWGDSHAQQLYFGLKTELPSNWQVMQVASSGCTPKITNKGESKKSYYCDHSNWFALKAISEAKPDVVIVAQKHNHDPEKMKKIAASLKSAGIKRVIFTGPVPQWVPNLPRVIAGSLWDNTPDRTYTGINPNTLAEDMDLKNKITSDQNQRYISLVDFFCNVSGCMTYIGNDKEAGIISNDDGHLTPIASVFLAKNLLVPIIENR